MRSALALLAAVAVALTLLPGGASAHYTPGAGDRFSYDETIALGSGEGNYTGYTESTVINGSLGVTAVAANATESAYYYNANSYSNNQGQSESWTSSGGFTFSSSTFHYVDGTDNQTGYVDPYVWFYMNNGLAVGGTFYLLNSPMTVVSTTYAYHLGTAAGNYVVAVFAEGNGSYQRNDVYGEFTASYNWKAFFDPATGYIIGYVYTEQDTDPAGDGFTLTDTLGVTATTYALTATSAPPSSSSGGPSLLLLVAVVAIVVVLVVVVIAVLLRRSGRARPLPKHSPTGQVSYAPPPIGPPPPAVRLSPGGQPAVQQIVIKETVKVKCAYCGALIDSTAERCPFCGAART